MSVRDEILAFLRDPKDFASSASAGTRNQWLEALRLTLEASSAQGKRLGSVQERAWREIADARLALILGPPGTGKTFALSWMALSYMLARRAAGLPCRVLLTGFTISSITNLLDGVAQKLPLVSPGDAKPPVFYAGSRLDAAPGGVEQIVLKEKQDREAVWDRLRQPWVTAGLTTWALYQLIGKCNEPNREGPTIPLFDLICIDEASQMMVGQGLMALSGMAPGCRVLVAGDDQQLEPVQAVFSREAQGRELGSSLYAFLRSAGTPEVAFEETRRMNRPLAAFGSREFYNDRFYPAPDVADQQLVLREGWREGLSDWQQVVLDPAYPVVVLLHDGPAAAVDNAFERAVLTELLRVFYERMTGIGDAGLTPEVFWRDRMAVITPHRAQNAALRAALGGTTWGKGCVVETVDRIQGKERDAILAGYTVSDTEFAQAEAEFLFSPNRLNVTTSRARRKLVFVVSRRLFEVVPAREEVIDAAQTLRRFVFGAEPVEGTVRLLDGSGREWPVELRVRRFEDAALPEALTAPDPRVPVNGSVVEFTPELQELDRVIREIARTNPWGNAASFDIEKRCLRKVPFGELRVLLILGRITLDRRGNERQFWVAKPVEPPREPYPIESATLRERLEVVIEELRQGWPAAWYGSVRDRFVWASAEGEDILRPHVQELVRTGFLEWDDKDRLRLKRDDDETLTVPNLPPLPALADEDFQLLNELENKERKRINFGIFESWVTLRELGAALGWGRTHTAASADRLRMHGHLLFGADDLCRSRMAELAREVRYVKQRFRPGDAAERPYLVRSLKLETKDRNKPVRDRSLKQLLERLGEASSGDPHAAAALAGLQRMLLDAWNRADDAQLAGFQQRALEKIFRSWTGVDSENAYVVTADTGSGKTEAAVLPFIAGAARDRLKGIRGTRALLVYPRIRLAHNQAQRLTGYLAQFAKAPDMPLLTIGVQSTGVPPSFPSQYIDAMWVREGDSYSFPFFDCPVCAKMLALVPGQGTEGADLLRCRACGWQFGGWIGSQKGIANTPPSFLLMVTESLHQWLQNPRYGLVFGDYGCAPPRAILADEIHLYALTHGANVGYALRRALGRVQANAVDARPPLAVGMSATLGNPHRVWGELCGRDRVVTLTPERGERRINPKGREYFYFVQPEVESRGKDIAGASTTIQSLMVLAHGMRRRSNGDGGYRGLVFLDSIDKVRRLHGDYLNAESDWQLARYRTYLYGDDPLTGAPRTQCCGQPFSCSRFRDGECWYFAATDKRQATARGVYNPKGNLVVGEWPVSSRLKEKTAEMLRKSDIIFSTSSLEVGYDDPDMTLVYQHYAPVNLASFVQRKGRGGRGADDRPVTGVTLSTYSPRDTWFFRRPEQMIDPAGFEIPLNLDNYFVRRGQAIAAMLDGVARWQAKYPNSLALVGPEGSFTLSQGAAGAADAMVRSIMGEGIYDDFGLDGISGLWRMAYSDRVGNIDRSKPPRDWGQCFRAMPRLLFETINLPFLSVLAEESQQPESADISLALTTAAPGNITRRYSPWLFHWTVPREGRHPWFDPEHSETREVELFPPGQAEAFVRELPESVRSQLVSGFHQRLSRPVRISLVTAGMRRGDFVPSWGVDRGSGTLGRLRGGDDTAIKVKDKSQGRLRSILTVRVDPESGECIPWSLPARFGALTSFVSSPGGPSSPGLHASRLFWAADANLKLDDRDTPEKTVTQFFVHPSSKLPMFSGYSIETEGVQVRLDTAMLDRFVAAEIERLSGGEEERWLKGKLLGYLLRTGAAASGLNTYHAIRAAELLQAAAGHNELRGQLVRLFKFWSPEGLRSLLVRTFEEVLPHHPLLTRRRIESLGDALADRKYKQAIENAVNGTRSAETFSRYLRSLVLNGVAVRLEQMFVLHGRGDEARVLAHVKTPMEYGVNSSDVISVFENGMHGDGTARTFLRHVEEVCQSWRCGELEACPSAEEDAIVDRMMAESEAHPEWEDLDPGSLGDMERFAFSLGIHAAHSAFDRVMHLRYGSELVGEERFELFDLHGEIRTVRERMRVQLQRKPTVWELVSAAAHRAEGDSAETPRLAALLRAYGQLQDAATEESLSPAARVADQVHRLSASLCVDGCQACLHAGADGAAGETAVSRLVLARYAETVFGSSGAGES